MHRLSEVQPCPMPTYANQKGKNRQGKVLGTLLYI